MIKLLTKGAIVELKRKIYQEILEWKKRRNGESALLIEGANRVGKSHICKVFGESEYKSYIFIDLSNQRNEVLELFNQPIESMELFFNKLEFIFGVTLFERNSLIILDEIQKCPKAREKIKHFVAYGKYDFIETGSLLSIKENIQDIIIPSEETSLKMFPLDFEEFLWAFGYENVYDSVRISFKDKIPLDNAVHNKLMLLFRQYMLIGGMPQAVLKYCDKKDFIDVDLVKKEILKLYKDDVGRYAKNNKSSVSLIFEQIPSQLSNHEKKFNISSLGKNSRYRNTESSFLWLIDAMISNCCYNITDPRYGLKMSVKNSSFKLYLADTGLLVTHAFSGKKTINNEIYRDILLDKLQINEGMIVENVVSQMLKSIGYDLFFFSNRLSKEDKRPTEIDFVIQKENKISPIEVKSGKVTNHHSIDKFSNKFKNKIGTKYIICRRNLQVEDDYVYIPFYMTLCL
jgi:predicted AAA+ superfamily ATPase